MKRAFACLAIVFILIVHGCQDSSTPTAVDSRAVTPAFDASPSELSALPFGPEIFERRRGKPKTEVRHFSVDGFDGPFALHLQNGDDQGNDKVTNARVFLNGSEIFGPDDFPDPDDDDGGDDDDGDDDDGDDDDGDDDDGDDDDGDDDDGDDDDGDDDDGDGDDDDDDESVSGSFADVRVVDVDLSGSSVLEVVVKGKRGTFLQIWIEDASQALIGPSGGTFDFQAGAVSVAVPAGALSEATVLTAEPTADVPGGTIPLPGTVLDFGPAGTTFAQPIEITVSYDPAEIPAGVAEESLRLFVEEDGLWEPLEGSVDPTARTVTGRTDHFSTFGVLSLVEFCPGVLGPAAYDNMHEAIGATLPGGTVQICDGTHSVGGAEVDRPLTFRPVAGASPTLVHDSPSFLASFMVGADGGYTEGTVLFEDLDFAVTSSANLSYAIRAEGAYHKLLVRNSNFTSAGNAPITGGIRLGASSVAGAVGRVEGSTFSGGWVAVFAGDDDDADVRLEVTGSTLSATSRVIFIRDAAPSSIDNSVFPFCGARSCIDAWRTPNLEIRDNVLHASSAQFPILIAFPSARNVVVEFNEIDRCGLRGVCVIFDLGSHGSVINNTITVNEDDGTNIGIFADENGEVFAKDNVITGTETDGDPETYALNFAGIAAANGAVIRPEENIIIGATFALSANTGLTPGAAPATIEGARGNQIDQVGAGFLIQNGSSMTANFNDITRAERGIRTVGGFGTVDLACNWWGADAAPIVSGDGALPPSAYTPWATGPVALSGDPDCTVGSTRVVYDASSDFDASLEPAGPGGTNPNGVWTYGWSFGAGGSVFDFPALREPADVNCRVQNMWLATGVTPSVSKTVGSCQDGNVAFSPGQLILHGEHPNKYASVVFRAPSAMVCEVSATFVSRQKSIRADVHVLAEGASLFSEPLNGDPGLSESFSTVLALEALDEVRFAVGNDRLTPLLTPGNVEVQAVLDCAVPSGG